MARLGFFLKSYVAAACFEPSSVELHWIGTFAGCSTDLAGNNEPGIVTDRPHPHFLWLDTYQKKILPNYLQADKVLGKSE